MGLIGILSIAILRSFVAFAPQVVFDTDPAFDPLPFAGLGMAGCLALDVLLLLACASALIGEWLSKRGVDPLLVLLALLPAPIVLWHGLSDAGDLWRGSTWVAAAIACAAIAHLARDPNMRSIILALLLAAIIPLLVRGVSQITYEHQETVRLFEQTKDEFFRNRGWEADSANARLYERRLRQADPTGWFASGNVFASLMAFGLVAFIGLGISAIRARLESGWTGALFLGAIASATGLWLSGSKGGILAGIIGLALLGFLLLTIQNPTSKIQNRIGLIVLALIGLAILAVVIRGTLLPESFAGDRSLLFRWHYLVAAMRIIAQAPLTGVGPDGFQQAYMLFRPPRNPEEVASAHSMFVDWFAALGVSGMAWIAMIAMLTWRAGALFKADAAQPNVRVSAAGTPTQAPQVDLRVVARSAGAMVVLAFIPAMMIEWGAVDGISLMLRIVGIVGFIGAALVIAFASHKGEQAVVNAAVISAIAVLLVHGQIEMTFHQPGSVVWAMAAVGLLGAGRAGKSRRSKIVGPIAGASIVAFAFAIAARGAVPACRQESAIMDAAAMLHPIAERAIDRAFVLERRQAAAATLLKAQELWPTNKKPLQSAIDQLYVAATSISPPSVGLLMQAQELSERALREHPREPSLVGPAVSINTQLALVTGDGEHWQTAISLARWLTQLDPNSISAWRRLGDVLWLRGDHNQAADAYRRALQADANFALDPLKQLSAKERDLITGRIAATEPNP